MKVAVLGTWHLGSVMSACLAQAGHAVVGFDPDRELVAGLATGRPPVAEPGLPALIAQETESGRLRFTTDVADAVRDADVVCVAFDTPVDDEDRADVEFVIRQVEAAFPALSTGAVVLSSSQLPVGTIRRIEQRWSAVAGERRVAFSCSPENLRLGKAIEVFKQPDRIVIGVRDTRSRQVLSELFAPITDRIEWMSVESAEMTKHAINGFLATSVTFINEIATLCEQIGADAREVERGLKTERRIGPGAYLSPGSAFAGGTLARDVNFLRDLGRASTVSTPLMEGVAASNLAHRQWAQRRLTAELGTVRDRRIAIWGLTYKPGTDTLRRSSALELCRWLVNQDARVHVHDPAAGQLPAELRDVTRHTDPLAAAAGADALVIATEWPEYRRIDPASLVRVMADRLVLDANQFLASTFAGVERLRCISVGRPQ